VGGPAIVPHTSAETGPADISCHANMVLDGCLDTKETQAAGDEVSREGTRGEIDRLARYIHRQTEALAATYLGERIHSPTPVPCVASTVVVLERIAGVPRAFEWPAQVSSALRVSH